MSILRADQLAVETEAKHLIDPQVPGSQLRGISIEQTANASERLNTASSIASAAWAPTLLQSVSLKFSQEPSTQTAPLGWKSNPCGLGFQPKRFSAGYLKSYQSPSY